MPVKALLELLEHADLPPIVMGLERVEALLAELGHPQTRLPPVIHVAGTNGKGSTLAYLSAICEAAGLRYHRYLSPHLVRFNERIRLQGEDVQDGPLLEALQRVHIATRNVPATFFEATTAAAFDLFARHDADVLLLETGLGGRLDATNTVAEPALCVITPIAMDHEAFLGNHLAAIAGEKAGIIKPGRPVFLAEQAPEADAVLHETAQRRGAPIRQAGRDWHYQVEAGHWEWQDASRRFILPSPALPGLHQFGNAALAIAVALEAFPDRITRAHLTQAMQRVEHPARLQALDRLPDGSRVPPGLKLWLDGGHNPQAGQALAAFLADQPSPRWLVTAMMRDKDAAGFLSPLAPVLDGMVATTVTGEPRSLPPEQLAEAARRIQIPAFVEEDIRSALQFALRQSGGQGSLLIGGSLYLAGELLTYVRQHRRSRP